MPLSLSLVTSDDLPGISHVHYNAFTDPFSVALHPRTSYSNHVEAYSNHLQRAMRKLSQHLYKVVDTSNGKIISFAKWSVACLNEEMAKQQTEKVEGRSENHNGNEEASKENVETQRNESEVITRPRSKVVNMEFGHAFKKKITDIQRKHVGDRKTLCAFHVLCGPWEVAKVSLVLMIHRSSLGSPLHITRVSRPRRCEDASQVGRRVRPQRGYSDMARRLADRSRLI